MFGNILAAVGGNILGGILQNNSAKAQANRQMEFQEDMSNTSYQRGMEDMRKAGLNPILAAKVGGASTPSGAAAPVENVIGPAVNSALATRQNIANVALTQAQTKKADAETTNILANTPAVSSKASADTTRNTMIDQALKGFQSSAESVRDSLPRVKGSLSTYVENLTKPLASSQQKEKLRQMRIDAWKFGTGFWGNSAKSLPNQEWPSGILKPPRSN